MTPSGEPPSEEPIRAALARGDSRLALALMMRAYGNAVFSFAARSLRDQVLAADVQQETFEQAYRDMHTYRQQASLRSWLFGIAQHRCLDAIKARARRERRFAPQAGEEAVDEVEHDPIPGLDSSARARALDECLALLPAVVRMAVILRMREEQTYEALARISQEKPDTVRARVVRALPALRSCLERKGIAP